MRAGPVGGAALLGVAVALGAAGQAVAQAPAGLHVASFRAPSSIVNGERAAVSGRVSPAAAVPVVVERLQDGGWAPLVTLRSTKAGRFSAALPLTRTSNLRVSVRGPDGAVASSRRRSVELRRRVTLTVTPDEPLESIAGRPFTADGVVRPAAAGEKVALQGAAGGHRWTTLATLPVRNGRVHARFTPPSGGRWRFRIAVPATPGRDGGGAAETPAIDVYGTNPDGVPASAPNYLVQHISEFHLYYYQYGTLRRVFPVVFGKWSTPTPVGRFAVYSKTTGPSAAFGPLVLWYHRGYGIHGTNQEYLLKESVRYFSHGCTRNYNVNIQWLWPRIPVGTPVVNIR